MTRIQAARLREVDFIAADPRLIRRDMVRAGIPVRGLEAAFNRQLSGPRAMLRRRVTLGVALGFVDKE